MKQKIDFDCNMPEGYRPLAFRLPVPGEHCLSVYAREVYVAKCSETPCVVVEKIPPTHRPATPADVKQPAEFSDDNRNWYPGILFAFDEERPVAKVENGYCSFNHARVKVEQYRDVTAADVGRDDVQFSDNGRDWTEPQRLNGFEAKGPYRSTFFTWKHARIRIDAPAVPEPTYNPVNWVGDRKPAKQPRGWWVGIMPNGSIGQQWPPEQAADARRLLNHGSELTFVREATPPQ